MDKDTHVLELQFGIDFSKVASIPYVNGIMMALNIKEESDLIEAYSKYLHDIIVGSIHGREEIHLIESGLRPTLEEDDEDDGDFEEIDMEDLLSTPSLLAEALNTKDKSPENIEPVYEDSEEISERFTKMINESLEEISVMSQVKIDELLIRKGISVDLDDLSVDIEESGIEVTKDVESFEEDETYGAEVPYKIILQNTKNKENKTVIVGGY